MSHRKTQPNGDVVLRFAIPKAVWERVSVVGARLLDLVGDTRADPGDVGLRALLRGLSENPSLIDEATTPRVASPPPTPSKASSSSVAGAGLMDRMLALDPKRPSGLAGIYTHGSYFRAKVRPSSGSGFLYLKSCRTPHDAALERLNYYIDHPELAYGAAELECDAMRRIDKMLAGKSDAEVWPAVLDHLQTTNRMHVLDELASLTPGPREPQLAAKRAALVGVREPPTPAPADKPTGTVLVLPQIFPTVAQRVAHQPDNVILGFEDGDLPPSFDDDWTPGRA